MAINSIRDVVTGGFCIGCGACAVGTSGVVRMGIDADGAYSVALESSDPAALSAPAPSCPFSDHAPDETQLAARFADSPAHDAHIGRYQALYAGRLTDETRLIGSSSGGLTGWLVEALLDRGIVDGVIHVGADEAQPGRLFSYRVSHSAAEARQSRKSIYYSATMHDVLDRIEGDGLRYALVGVPCFIKAARLLMRQRPALDAQLALLIGLVCGHLKTPAFAEALAWQAGVAPDQLAAFDFRLKDPAESAKRYRYGALAKSEPDMRTRLTSEALGGDWGHGMFQMSACDYCDDIFAETADVCFGDAWLPQYDQDWRGTNIVVVRSALVDELIQDAHARHLLTLDSLAVDQVIASQAGNFRHRWDGLSVRLTDAKAQGRDVPRKRITPGARPVSLHRRALIRLRQKMSAASHFAFRRARAAGDFARFSETMLPMVGRMRRLYRIERAIRRRGWLARIASMFRVI